MSRTEIIEGVVLEQRGMDWFTGPWRFVFDEHDCNYVLQGADRAPEGFGSLTSGVRALIAEGRLKPEVPVVKMSPSGELLEIRLANGDIYLWDGSIAQKASVDPETEITVGVVSIGSHEHAFVPREAVETLLAEFERGIAHLVALEVKSAEGFREAAIKAEGRIGELLQKHALEYRYQAYGTKP